MLRDRARMFDLRTSHRHLRAGRVTEAELEQFVADLPDRASNVCDPDDGGEEDGFDRRYGLAPEPPAPPPTNKPLVIPPMAPPAAAAPRIPEIPPQAVPPRPIPTLDPLAHLDTSNERLAALENNPMMPPPQPIPVVPLPPVSQSTSRGRDDDDKK